MDFSFHLTHEIKSQNFYQLNAVIEDILPQVPRGEIELKTTWLQSKLLNRIAIHACGHIFLRRLRMNSTTRTINNRLEHRSNI